MIVNVSHEDKNNHHEDRKNRTRMYKRTHPLLWFVRNMRFYCLLGVIKGILHGVARSTNQAK